MISEELVRAGVARNVKLGLCETEGDVVWLTAKGAIVGVLLKEAWPEDAAIELADLVLSALAHQADIKRIQVRVAAALLNARRCMSEVAPLAQADAIREVTLNMNGAPQTSIAKAAINAFLGRPNWWEAKKGASS